MKEAQEGLVHWPEVEIDTFVRLASFAYTNDYYAAEPEVVKEYVKNQASVSSGKPFAPTEVVGAVGAAAELLSSGGLSSASVTINTVTPPVADGPASPVPALVPLNLEAEDSDAALEFLAGLDDVDAENPPAQEVGSDRDTDVMSVKKELYRGAAVPPYSIKSWLDRYDWSQKYARANIVAHRNAEAGKYGPGRKRPRNLSSATDDNDDGSGDTGSGWEDWTGPDVGEDTNFEDVHLSERRSHRATRAYGWAIQPPDLSRGTRTGEEPFSRPFWDWSGEERVQSTHFVMNKFFAMTSTTLSPYPGGGRCMRLCTQKINDKTATQLPVFLSHTSLYFLADMYGIESLCKLSLRRLHDCLLHYRLVTERVADLVTLTEVIYDNTMEGDKARNLMVNFWLCFLEFVGSDPDFKALVRAQGDFAASLMGKVALRIQHAP